MGSVCSVLYGRWTDAGGPKVGGKYAQQCHRIIPPHGTFTKLVFVFFYLTWSRLRGSYGLIYPLCFSMQMVGCYVTYFCLKKNTKKHVIHHVQCHTSTASLHKSPSQVFPQGVLSLKT